MSESRYNRGDSQESESGPVVHTEPSPNQAESDLDMATAKSTKSPAFQFYPRDFLSSDNVDRMSMTERGVYITLMSKYWLAGDLPADMSELAGMVRMKTPQFERMWTQGKLHLCFHERGGRLVQPRLEDERRKQKEFQRRQSDNGSKGGRPKKAVGISGLTQPIATGKPTESSASAFASSTAFVSAGRAQPLVQRRRLDAAFEGGRLYVPQRAHSDLLSLRNHPDAERELFAWYGEICEDWTHGANKATNADADMIRFWKARYAEKWPPPAQASSFGQARKPAWAPK